MARAGRSCRTPLHCVRAEGGPCECPSASARPAACATPPSSAPALARRAHRRRGRARALVVAPGAAVPAQAASGAAPGAPGHRVDWVPGDKDGFGTARGTASKVWYTLSRGTLNEVYYPRIDTPSLRDSQFVVTDGSTFTDREDRDATHQVQLLSPNSLTYRLVNTAKSGDWRITKTFVTDPARSSVLEDVRFESLTGKAYQVYLLHDLALSMTGNDDTGRTGTGGACCRCDGTQRAARS